MEKIDLSMSVVLATEVNKDLIWPLIAVVQEHLLHLLPVRVVMNARDLEVVKMVSPWVIAFLDLAVLSILIKPALQ